RHAGKTFCAGVDGADSRGKQSSLVLRRQTALASEPDIQLSALEDLGNQSFRLWMVARDGGPRRGDLLREASCRAKRRGRGFVLCDDAGPGSGVHHALHVPILVRGRSLPVCREHRAYYAVFGRTCASCRLFETKEAMAGGDGLHRVVAGAWDADLAAGADLLQR